MDTGELAKLLDGRNHCDEITAKEAAVAKASGLLVVFGYSDDNMELRGFVNDEVGCYDGGTFHVDEYGIRLPWDEDEPTTEQNARTFFARESLPSFVVRAMWCAREPFSWTYFTTAAVYDRFVIMEDGGPFCEGLVIDCSTMKE